MPIRGLTRRQDVTPRFTRLGKLKKGKTAPVMDSNGRQKMRNGKPVTKPVDLDHFRFVGEGSRASEIEAAFVEIYGAEPREIDVLLPYKTVDENWQTWMEEWGKSGLIHRCDGEVMVRWLNDEDKTYSSDDKQLQEQPCPYHAGTKTRTKKNPGCTRTGRLAVVIPSLLEAGFVGYVTVEIHSLNDLVNLTSTLIEAEEKSSASGGLQGIWFKLRRQLEEIGIGYTGSDGKPVKTRGDKWMVRLDPAREWVQHRLEVSQQASLGQAVPRPALEVEHVTITELEPAELTPIDADEAPFVEAEATEIKEPEPQPDPEQPAIRYAPKTLQGAIAHSVAGRRKDGFKFTADKPASNFATAIVGNLEACFADETDKTAARHAVLWYLTGKQSSKDLDDAEIKALHQWLDAKPDDEGKWHIDEMACREAHAVYAQALREQGQTDMFADETD